MIDDAIPISHSPSPILASETPEAASVFIPLQSKVHLWDNSGTLSDEVLHLQGEMNMAKGGYSLPGPLWKPTVEGWYWTLKPPSIKMKPGPPRPLRR